MFYSEGIAVQCEKTAALQYAYVYSDTKVIVSISYASLFQLQIHSKITLHPLL